VNPTVNVLGLEIPRSGTLFFAVLTVHVPAGLTAVVTGAGAALSKKGSRRHICLGRLYFWALCVVFATALVLAFIRWREDFHLALIGAVAFAAACMGHLRRDRHRPGHALHIRGMGASYVMMLVAFYVDNGPLLPIWNRLPHAMYWGLPIAVGAPLTWRAVRRAREAGGSKAAVDRPARARD
jgi:uncharacterized membrane protein